MSPSHSPSNPSSVLLPSKGFLLCLGLAALVGCGESMTMNAPAPAAENIFEANRRLGKGINLGNMLEAPGDGAWGQNLEMQDFRIIKAAGFNSVRMPIRWQIRAKETAPYTIEPAFMKRVEDAVKEAEKQGLNIVINAHHFEEILKEPDANLPKLIAFWEQIGARFKGSSNRVYFELLNEPNDKLTEEKWNEFLPKLMTVVRKTNPTRPVIIGPGRWNNMGALPTLKLPKDPNIIVTVHNYDPFEFTHQGAEWVNGADKWKDRAWNGSAAELTEMRRGLTATAAWAKQNNVPIYVGEFGAYSKADSASRIRWTRALTGEMNKLGFSWAYWEYSAGFGVYDKSKKAWNADLKNALLAK